MYTNTIHDSDNITIQSQYTNVIFLHGYGHKMKNLYNKCSMLYSTYYSEF